MGSWNDVRGAATRVAVECREEVEGRKITGGSTVAGVRGGIVVRLEKEVASSIGNALPAPRNHF